MNKMEENRNSIIKFGRLRYFLKMRTPVIICALLFLLSCGKKDVVLQTYSTIDSSVGNYAGSWYYKHHVWQNNIRVIKIDTTYNDTIVVSKVNDDSLIIKHIGGAYRFKFDKFSNSYSDGFFMQYTIDVVAHTISATGNSTHWSNSGNSDTVVYQFNGKR